MDKQQISAGARRFVAFGGELYSAVIYGQYNAKLFEKRSERTRQFIEELDTNDDARLRKASAIMRRMLSVILRGDPDTKDKIAEDNTEFMRIMKEVT